MNYTWKVRFVMLEWFFTLVEVYVEIDKYQSHYLSFHFLPWRSPDFVYDYIEQYINRKRIKLNREYDREASFMLYRGLDARKSKK